jgi:outer membrane biosynthesis protein TonB
MPERSDVGPSSFAVFRGGAVAVWILLSVIAATQTETLYFLLLLIVPLFWFARRPAFVLAGAATLALAGCGTPPAYLPEPVHVDSSTATPAEPTATETTTTVPATTTTTVTVPAPPPAPAPVPKKPKPPAPKPAAPAPKPKPPAPRRSCDPSYPTVCIPSAPPDLDCGQIPHKRFVVRGADPHGFDGNDNDGIGCES